MWQLQIQVFSGVDAKRENKVLFERIIDISDSIHIPFSSLLSDFKFLYGNSCLVSFNIL